MGGSAISASAWRSRRRPAGLAPTVRYVCFEYSLTEMPKSQGHGQALVLEQRDADAIVNACSPALRAVFSFARCTAARISEVLNLRFENLTSAHVVLPKRICKGKKKTREVPINGRLAEEIRTWKSEWQHLKGRPPGLGLSLPRKERRS